LGPKLPWGVLGPIKTCGWGLGGFSEVFIKRETPPSYLNPKVSFFKVGPFGPGFGWVFPLEIRFQIFHTGPLNPIPRIWGPGTPLRAKFGVLIITSGLPLWG